MLRAAAPREARPPLLLPAGAQTTTSLGAPSSARRSSRSFRPSSSIAAGSRTGCWRRCASPASRCVDDCAVKRIELGPARTRSSSPARRQRDGADALAGRRERPDRPAPPPARPDPAGRSMAPTRRGSASRRASRVDDWSDDPTWQARVPTGERWMSTNHLMGKGYWVWLIPLGSGSTSIGIVADDDLHPCARINRYERAIGVAARVRAAVRQRSIEALRADARGLPRAQALRARLRAGLLAGWLVAGRRSGRCSPIRSTRPAPTSSRSATTAPPI